MLRTANDIPIILNGEAAAVSPGTIASLLESLGLAPVRVAVEVNERLVPRKQFSDTALQPGDRVEVVTFVGGG